MKERCSVVFPLNVHLKSGLSLTPKSLKCALLFLFLAMSFSLQSHAKGQILPDACGDDKVKFDITLQENHPALSAPEPGKAQVVLIETSKKPTALGCMGRCGDVTRFGLDGAWVGATKNNSFFTVEVNPGEHHLCAVLGKDADPEALTAEAGKTYYFEVNYDADGTQYGTPEHPNYQIKKYVSFTWLKEDEGKYRVKASKLSTATQKK